MISGSCGERPARRPHRQGCALVGDPESSGRRSGCLPLGCAMKLVPDLDERLSLGVAPGQAGRFQFVGPKAPLLSSIDRPIGHHAAVGQGVKDRRRRLGGRGRIPAGDGARRFDGTAKSGIPGLRLWPYRVASLILIPQLDGEPSLDTPNARPQPGPPQGPKLTHGRNLQTYAVIRGSRVNRFFVAPY